MAAKWLPLTAIDCWNIEAEQGTLVILLFKMTCLLHLKELQMDCCVYMHMMASPDIIIYLDSENGCYILFLIFFFWFHKDGLHL